MDLSAAMQALLQAETHRCEGAGDAAEAAYFDAARLAVESLAADSADARNIVMRARIGLGRVELHNAAPGRALGWFLSAGQIAPADWRPHYWRGAALGWLGDHAGAAQSCTAELRRTPGELSLKIQRCCAQLKMGQVREALRGVLTTGTGALDGSALHALCSAWLTGTSAKAEPAGTRIAVAAVAALRHHANFWERFRASAAARYRVPIPSEAITWCRSEVEHRARERLISDDTTAAGSDRQQAGEPLLLRELAAADVLRELGGLAPAGSSGPAVVCGPLMISLLGMQDALAVVLARAAPQDPQADEPVPNEPTLNELIPDAARRIRTLFSGLGAARALLEAERPEDALVAVQYAACSRCRCCAAPEAGPPVCAPDCADFDTLHPGYAGLRAKGLLLAEDAAAVWIAAMLGTARRLVSTDGADPGAVRQRWKDALKLAAGIGKQDQVGRRISETVLGRTRVLTGEALFSEAIALTEEAISVLGSVREAGHGDSSARDELQCRLAELLTDRGVLAGNEGNWDDCMRDLRRGMQTNPRAARPRINLSIALQRLARYRRDEGNRVAARELLREAKRIIEGASPQAPHSPQMARQAAAVTEDLRSLCAGWAIELAMAGAYREALEVLDEGLADLPADDRLLAARHRLDPLWER